MKAIDWPRVCLEVELVDPDAAAGQSNRQILQTEVADPSLHLAQACLLVPV